MPFPILNCSFHVLQSSRQQVHLSPLSFPRLIVCVTDTLLMLDSGIGYKEDLGCFPRHSASGCLPERADFLNEDVDLESFGRL